VTFWKFPFSALGGCSCGHNRDSDQSGLITHVNVVLLNDPWVDDIP
jgi:hypothetical protein